MSSPGPSVEVVPASVVPVFGAMRELARACFSCGYGLGTHTPWLPPGFAAEWRVLAGACGRDLRGLALDLEAAAACQWGRLAQLEAAGGEAISMSAAPFIGDAVATARACWGQTMSERASDELADPFGRAVHVAAGAVDNVASLWRTLSVLVAGTPLYGRWRPGGGEARRELVAMGLNLARMSPAWALLEPEDAFRAASETVGRAVDVQDLESGDPARWAGHVGTGLVAGKGAEALAADAGETLLPAAIGTTYRAVNQANKVPVTSRAKARTPLGKRVLAAENRGAEFLENVVP